jgi:uncharacterized protein (TIGR03790 family)
MVLKRFARAAFCLAVAAATPPVAAYAQSAENVAVVINESSPDSQRIGEYYAKKRAIPPGNVIRIRAPLGERVDREVYNRAIEVPIREALVRERLQDRVLFLVLTKGVPLIVDEQPGRAVSASNTTQSSVDSELTLLYRRMSGQPAPLPGRVANPYFLGTADIAKARSFSHREHDIYLVTRLDGFTVDDVIGLIDRGTSAKNEGRVVLDQQDKLVNRTGEDWLKDAATRLSAQGLGDRVVLESTVAPVRKMDGVLGYFSWGSNDPRNRVRKTEMTFVPGAVAGSFVSTDARTFREPPAEWVPDETTDQKKWFGGSAQSLAGDLIREGVTGVAGHVSEPFLQSTVRPDILFPAYLAGFTLVESFYLATPSLGWMTVIVGDPLCAPVERPRLARAEIEDGLDQTTGLPALFSKRRLALAKAASKGVPERAIVQLIRGETLMARNEIPAARAAFEEALKLAPNHPGALLQLGGMQDAAGEHEAAAQKYRRVLEIQPSNPVALNNLAYNMAVHGKKPAEALPLARRAVAIVGNDPVILDTLAWIQHLVGDNASALKGITQAVRGAPDSAEILMHSAVIQATAGARKVAEDQLKEAIRLNPKLESSPEAKRVRELLEKSASK